jgi:hypothetical protein
LEPRATLLIYADLSALKAGASEEHLTPKDPRDDYLLPHSHQQTLWSNSSGLLCCHQLLLLPNAPFMVHGRAWNMQQERSEIARRTGQPRAGKPEGTFPDLIESRKGHQVERELPAAVPSTIRSRKNPEQPWNGKRFGEVGPNHEQSDNGAGAREPNQKRAHAKRVMSPPPVLDDTFIDNSIHTLCLPTR